MTTDFAPWKITERGIECDEHPTCLVPWRDLEEEADLEDAVAKATILRRPAAEEQHDKVEAYNVSRIERNHVSFADTQSGVFNLRAALDSPRPLEAFRQQMDEQMKAVAADAIARAEARWKVLEPFYSAKWEAIRQIKSKRVEAAVADGVREASGKPGIPARVRFQVLQRDNFRCQLCGRSANDGVRLEVDHSDARSKGGVDTIDNLWTLCQDCNRGKSDLDLLR